MRNPQAQAMGTERLEDEPCWAQHVSWMGLKVQGQAGTSPRADLALLPSAWFLVQ